MEFFMPIEHKLNMVQHFLNAWSKIQMSSRENNKVD